MRLRQYLTEDINFPDTVKLIKKDCKPFLNETDSLMWRGFKSTAGKSFPKLKVHQDRRPLSTGNEEHKFLDESFNRVFGFKARSQTIFCTGSMDIAASYGYGRPYMIFPIGKYKYLWSPEVEDIYASIFHVIANKIKFINTIETRWNKEKVDDWEHKFGKPKHGKTDEYHKKVMDYEIKKAYKNTNLTNALKSNNEIMVYCKEYYAISYTYKDMIWGALK